MMLHCLFQVQIMSRRERKEIGKAIMFRELTQLDTQLPFLGKKLFYGIYNFTPVVSK
jgi:hypothetical protein